MMSLNSAQGRKALREEFGVPDPRVPALRKREDAHGRRMSQTYQQAMSRIDVKDGDVAQDGNHGLCVITGHSLHSFYQRRLPTGGRMHRSFSSILSGYVSLVTVFRPPETHVHPFTVYPLRGEEYGEEYYARAKRLQAYVAANIRPEDRLEHEPYGTFWAKSAIASLTKDFEKLEAR